MDWDFGDSPGQAGIVAELGQRLRPRMCRATGSHSGTTFDSTHYVTAHCRKQVLPTSSRPQFDSKVRVNTEVLPIVLIGAHMLRLNGIDMFSKKYGKYTLHDVVAHHAGWVSRTGTTKVKTEEISDKVARSIMRSEGGGTHQAWISLYLAHFPKSHAAGAVRKLHSQVKRAQNIPYYGRNMGVHSACYFGL